MTKLKSLWIVGVGGAALIVAMTAFPSFVAESHGEMMHGGDDQQDQDDP